MFKLIKIILIPRVCSVYVNLRARIAKRVFCCVVATHLLRLAVKERTIALRIASPFSPRCSIRAKRVADCSFNDMPSINANFSALPLPIVFETPRPVKDERFMASLFVMRLTNHDLVSKCKGIRCPFPAGLCPAVAANGYPKRNAGSVRQHKGW